MASKSNCDISRRAIMYQLQNNYAHIQQDFFFAFFNWFTKWYVATTKKNGRFLDVLWFWSVQSIASVYDQIQWRIKMQVFCLWSVRSVHWNLGTKHFEFRQFFSNQNNLIKKGMMLLKRTKSWLWKLEWILFSNILDLVVKVSLSWFSLVFAKNR